MQKELKDKWIEALRSGDYKQAKSALMLEDGSACCLGVLCAVMEVPKTLVEDQSRYCFEFGHYRDTSMFQDYHARQLGIVNANGIPVDGDLMGMNDGQNKTFAEIADYIQETIRED